MFLQACLRASLFFGGKKKKQGDAPLLDKHPAGQYNKSRATVPLTVVQQMWSWQNSTLSVTEATISTKIQVSTTSTPDTTLPSSADLSPLTHQRPANGYGESSL